MKRSFGMRADKKGGIFSVVPSLFWGAIIGFLFIQLSMVNVYAATSPAVGTSDGTAAEPADAALAENHYVLPFFSSSLPLLTLAFPDGTLAQEAENYYVAATVQGYGGQPTNTLGQNPSFQHAVTLRNMTDPANQTDEKHDYYLQLESGQSLLGLGAASEYLLLGGMHDKSLIRNYLGYSMAAKIMPTPVEFQLCELFFHNENGDLYQGVYLLVALTVHETPDTLLFYRNESGEGIQIDTGTAASGYTTIPFMEGGQWDDRFDSFIGGLSTAEHVLYSSTPQTFYQYSSRFDTPAFIGAFILGELAENYAGMTDAYYLYDSGREMLTVAPIWRFDQAFDNQADWPVTARMIHYTEAPYHDGLLKSPQYTRRLQETYLALRQNGLEEAQLLQMVDAGVALAAPTLTRDWARWNGYNTQALQPLTELELNEKSEDGSTLTEPIVPLSRQRERYEDEIKRIKTTLREHSLYFSYGITQFDFSEREISREIVMNTNPIWAIVFLAVAFALVRFARRYGV